MRKCTSGDLQRARPLPLTRPDNFHSLRSSRGHGEIAARSNGSPWEQASGPLSYSILYSRARFFRAICRASKPLRAPAHAVRLTSSLFFGRWA